MMSVILRYINPHGGGNPLCCTSHQQSAIPHGLVQSVNDVSDTFDDMCQIGTSAQCRSYFIVCTLHGYETHAIYDNVKQRKYMYYDCIQFKHYNVMTL
jgi:hypothetical protein